MKKEEAAESFGGMQFCPECNNMLYPKGNGDRGLTFSCKNCRFSREVEGTDIAANCIFQRDIKKAETDMIIDPECCLDSTLSRARNIECEKCGFKEAVFFQNPAVDSDQGMNLIFVCARYENGQACGEWWSQKTS